MKKLTVDLERCNHCRRCELACSFRRTKTFSPDQSCITIFKMDDRMRAFINPDCDLCEGEPFLWCQKYCFASALEVIDHG